MNNEIKRLAKKVDKRPNDTESLLSLGKAQFCNSDFDAAIDAYQKVILIDPNNVSAHYNLAQAFRAKKMYEDAKSMFRKVLELDPENTSAQEELHKLVKFTE